MWRYASIEELTRTILGSLTASILHCILITAIYCRMPMSYYVWGSMLQMLFVVGLRFLFRFLLFLRSHMWKRGEPGGRVMVICADGYKLGGWVSDQREKYRAGKMKPERKKRLDALGMIWDPPAKEVRRRRIYPSTGTAAQA